MKRDKFSLSHYKLTTMDMGLLVPLTWYEALPGDSIQHMTSALIRVVPLLAPVMHPVRVRIHHWFVPNRLIWDGWENFITGGPDGKNSDTPPYFETSEISSGSLEDHMGLMPKSYSTPIRFSALPFRAYNMIYNEYYRDQDLCSEVAFAKTSGADAVTPKNLLRCSWEKDYFTTARPWAQKGDEVTIPLGDKAPLMGIGKLNQVFAGTGSVSPYMPGGTQETWEQNTYNLVDGDADAKKILVQQDPDNPGYPNLYADLSEATGISISDLRLALAIQRYQEARAQYGSRYVEYLRYLGVRSSDARLQNPEYLGGGRQIIQFSEIIQSAPGNDPDTSVVGDLKGHGIAAIKAPRFRRFFEEHGIVMTIMSVVPKAIYTTAQHRKWNRVIKEDYFQKELQYIGDQVVENREIQADHSQPLEAFGYQQRYDEYRSHPSYVSGEFRQLLNYWHYAREFSGDVALNQSFVDAVPTKRVYAEQTQNCLYVMSNHKIRARRAIKKNPVAQTF